jgi:uncharacterized membrane protein
MDMACIVFNDKQKADECLNLLRSLNDEALFDLVDACIATRDESGKVQLEQAFPRTGIGVGIGAFGGLAWGLMLAFLCSFNPAVATAAGIVATGTVGGLIGKLSDYGIDDEFIQRIADELQPGTSAIFVLFGRLTPDKVLPQLRQLNGTILTSDLPAEREERLRAALLPLAEQQAGDTPACNN